MAHLVKSRDFKLFGPCVYFLRCGDFLKVGFTSEYVMNRLSSIQTGNPHTIELVAFIKAGREVEREIHASLKERHHGGEWYRIGESFPDVIASLVLPRKGRVLKSPITSGWARHV